MSNKSTEVSIWLHLDELRKRLLYSVLAIVVGVVISIIFADFLLEVIAQPIGGFDQLLSIQVTENFSVYFRVTLLGGFILALPFLFFQIYLFIAPGLTKQENKWVLLAIPSATILFLAGALFAYFVMLPAALPFLVEFPGPNVLPKWKDYVDFVTGLVFWIGICFEAPLLMYLLAKIGIVDARGFAKQWRFAIIFIAVISAVATPTPDPINMALLILPLLGLYGLGILLAMLARNPSDKPKKKKEI